MSSKKFYVKDYMDINTYNRLLVENCKDIQKQDLKIGDKVAYATATTEKCVSVGEIVDMWMEYFEKYDYSTRQSVLDMNYMATKIKIKGILGARGVTRKPNHVVKL